MKENNKQELSYFRLKLRSYMSEHHPEKLHDTELSPHGQTWLSLLTAMQWHKVLRTSKQRT